MNDILALFLSLGIGGTTGLAIWTWWRTTELQQQVDWLTRQELRRMVDADMEQHADDLLALNEALGGDA